MPGIIQEIIRFFGRKVHSDGKRQNIKGKARLWKKVLRNFSKRIIKKCDSSSLPRGAKYGSFIAERRRICGNQARKLNWLTLCRAERISVQTSGEDYDDCLKKILDKCTAYDPAQRFQSVDDLRRKILAAEYLIEAKKLIALAVIAFGIFFVMDLPYVETPTEENFNEVREDFNISIGGLKFGDSIDTMRKIFGMSNEIRISEDLPDTFYYEYKDVVVTVKNNFVIGIATYTDVFADSKGIRQGDSLDKVIAAYGADVWKVESEDGEVFYEYPFESERGLFVMRFAIKDNVVEYISLRLDND